MGPDRIKVTAASAKNVQVQFTNPKPHTAVTERLNAGDLLFFGWMYEIGMGRVFCYDEDNGRFYGPTSTGMPMSGQTNNTNAPSTANSRILAGTPARKNSPVVNCLLS